MIYKPYTSVHICTGQWRHGHSEISQAPELTENSSQLDLSATRITAVYKLLINIKGQDRPQSCAQGHSMACFISSERCSPFFFTTVYYKDVQPVMAIPSSPLLPMADSHSVFFPLQSTFSSCEWHRFPFCILSQLLFSCLHFPGLYYPLVHHFFKNTYSTTQRVASGLRSTCCTGMPAGTGASQVLWAVWWETGKGASSEGLEKAFTHQALQSASLSPFIANSRIFLVLYCRSELCLGHDLLLDFKNHVNIVGPAILLADRCHANASVTRVWRASVTGGSQWTPSHSFVNWAWPSQWPPLIYTGIGTWPFGVV